jgi:hypothetical protein
MHKPLVAFALAFSPLMFACGAAPKADAAAPAAPTPATAATPAAAAAIEPGASLRRLRLELPCKGEKFEKGEECHWDQSLAVAGDPTWKLKLEHAVAFGGAAGKLYDVTLRVRGVVEPKNFSDGDVKAEHFQSGGTAVTDHYNFYNIEISEPHAVFTVNRHVDKVGHFVFALDYQVTIPIRGGAQVKLGAYDSNDIEIANHKSLSVPEVAPTPFDGQFFQIDVVSVTEQAP